MGIKSVYNKLIAWTYSIGFLEYEDSIVLEDIPFPEVHWIKGIPNGHWFADPFILSASSDVVEVLAENYSFKDRKAVISRLTVDRKTYHLISIQTVINLPTHLSFPAYYRKDGKVFIYPESSKTGRLSLYEYDEITGQLAVVKDLNPYPLADAIIEKIDGRMLILATRCPDDNGRTLLVYPYFDENCPSIVEPLQRITFSDNSARNAGAMLKIGNRIVRAAQNSNQRYGESLVFQELKSNSEGQISFHELKRIYSPSRRYNLTFHTFNVLGDLAVVDGSGYRFGFIGRILESLRDLLRK